jgi:hypothetical protein
MSGEDAPRPCPEDLIVLEIKTNKQISGGGGGGRPESPEGLVYGLTDLPWLSAVSPITSHRAM